MLLLRPCAPSRLAYLCTLSSTRKNIHEHHVKKGISMKMSSCRWGLEGGPVAQHRPQDVDPPSRQRDQGLGVLLALTSLAVVEGPRVRRGAQAGKGRLVEDPFEDLVA